MVQQDLVAIFITFGMGLVAGVYLYFSGFVPFTSNLSGSLDFSTLRIEDNSFTVVGEMYGGCAMANTCSSFQITEDRAYRYRSQPSVGIRTGVVPESRMNALQSAAVDAPLERFAREHESDSCDSYVDGIDYRYSIEVGRDRYLIDTCTTEFDSNSELGETLTDLWQYFETGGR